MSSKLRDEANCNEVLAGVTDLKCYNGGRCESEKDGESFKYFCECSYGWIGDSCEIADPCLREDVDPCDNGSVCESKLEEPYVIFS